MGDEPAAADSPLSLQLRTAGIPEETLKKAAETASRLCAGSRPLEGGTLDPRSAPEYQQLIASLAREASQ